MCVVMYNHHHPPPSSAVQILCGPDLSPAELQAIGMDCPHFAPPGTAYLLPKKAWHMVYNQPGETCMSIAWDTFFETDSSKTDLHRSTGTGDTNGDICDRRFVLLGSGTHSGLHHDTLCSMGEDKHRNTVGRSYKKGGRFFVDAAGVLFPIRYVSN